MATGFSRAGHGPGEWLDQRLYSAQVGHYGVPGENHRDFDDRTLFRVAIVTLRSAGRVGTTQFI